uniref:Uncharacterized protein n=1 Tax=Pseudomonas syringae pv. actinidiae TaxID=103796 RepID=A0A2P0QG62_PSESF|nr:hypothetical protein [Pseudomonas syringae pv. actinidiae]
MKPFLGLRGVKPGKGPPIGDVRSLTLSYIRFWTCNGVTPTHVGKSMVMNGNTQFIAQIRTCMIRKTIF